ncbi:hypothetical protein DEU29_105180 [Idiomarina aquatica]|uniref:Uncharacterized protein n=1 Tax=Idiomarina aquatica TaxID=1327752 RepID=A0A4R6PIW4_9GAMM|nr:hypothetical protein [Idiomarina aquatica]TDP38328.1 hypothetical protein DEU29_105180 [Idiomarina aquatica]
MKIITKIALVATAITMPFMSSADVVSSSEQGFQIKIEQPYEGTADSGYQRFVNDINQWWLDDHTWFGDAEKLSIDATAWRLFLRNRR